MWSRAIDESWQATQAVVNGEMISVVPAASVVAPVAPAKEKPDP
jgi:hypothetical protein